MATDDKHKLTYCPYVPRTIMYLLGHHIILKFSKDFHNKLSAASSFSYTNSKTGQSAINLESKFSHLITHIITS